MASWKQLEQAWPEITDKSLEQIRRFRVGYLGTYSDRHGPRIHPVSPVVVAGGLYLGIIESTPKCRDLLTDGRYVLHTPPGPSDAEFWVRGTAVLVSAAERQRLVAVDRRLDLPAGDLLFELLINVAQYAIYSPGPDGLPRAARQRWMPAKKLDRRPA